MYVSPQRDFAVPDLPDNPTPEDRATYLVLRLEQFIREGRTIDEGMSFRKWQAMALAEIAAAVADAQNEVQKDDPVTRRLLFTASAALVTIGFWGAAVSIHKVAYLAAAAVCGGAGLLLLAVACEWRLRKLFRRRAADKRRERLKRIEGLNRRIKRLEKELEKEAKGLEKQIDAAKKVRRKHAGAIGAGALAAGEDRAPAAPPKPAGPPIPSEV